MRRSDDFSLRSPNPNDIVQEGERARRIMTAIREHAVARLRNVLNPLIVHAFGRSFSFPKPEDIAPALGQPLSSATAESDDSESLDCSSEKEPCL